MARFTIVFLTTFATSSATLFAHPGHGNTDSQPIAHYFLEPQHAATVMLISVLTISGLLVWRGQRRRAAAFAD